MIVTNRTNSDRYFRYKVNGNVNEIFFNSGESIEISDLVDLSQVIYNSYDLKLKNLSERFPSRNITPTFTFGNAEVPVLPSSLIQVWYNSLLIKPSNSLLTDLNTLVDGIDADGNWTKMDLFGLVAGMETDEQRLRPLISTSGEDFIIENGVVLLNTNGINSNGGGNLNLKWNPTDDGVQYSLNSCFISSYCSQDDIAFSLVPLGSSSGDGSSSSYILRNSTTISGVINNDGVDSFPTIDDAETEYYCAVVLSGGNSTLYKNALTNTVAINTPILPMFDFQGAGLNIEDSGPSGYGGNTYLRHFMAGAGDANQTQIMSRLNTFYTARGL